MLESAFTARSFILSDLTIDVVRYDGLVNSRSVIGEAHHHGQTGNTNAAPGRRCYRIFIGENDTMAITEQLLTGSAVAENLDDIASLRITIFREFPYLYDGRREDESRYLQVYANDPDTIVITVSDSGKIVGAATGIPLRHEHQELVEPFAGSDYSLDEIYYVGELLFYPEYRNRGLGLRLVERMEEQVRSLESYRYLTCATVVRSNDHSLRPAAYLPIDRFLAVAGFYPLPEMMTEFSWLETDGITHGHPMNFWLKEL